MDFVRVIFGGVVLVVDVAPGGADVLGGVDRVLLVRGVRIGHVAVLPLALLRVHVLAPVDLGAHAVLLGRWALCPFPVRSLEAALSNGERNKASSPDARFGS